MQWRSRGCSSDTACIVVYRRSFFCIVRVQPLDASLNVLLDSCYIIEQAYSHLIASLDGYHLRIWIGWRRHHQEVFVFDKLTVLAKSTDASFNGDIVRALDQVPIDWFLPLFCVLADHKVSACGPFVLFHTILSWEFHIFDCIFLDVEHFLRWEIYGLRICS